MKKHSYLLKTWLCALVAGILAGCSSDEETTVQVGEGKGAVMLSLSADTGFGATTRAVDESSYEDLSQYTVQILDSDGNVVDGCEWTGDNLPTELVVLDNGDYTLKAFAGEEYEGAGVSTEGFYVAGETTFNVNSDEATVSVECTPQCARVTVDFDDAMATYFNDYYVVYEGTEALGSSTFIWGKDDEDPAYLYLTDTETVTATIKLVDSKGKVGEDIVRTKELAPAKAWTLTIAPVVEGTSELGISISLDTSTNDREVDIEIPANWL